MLHDLSRTTQWHDDDERGRADQLEFLCQRQVVSALVFAGVELEFGWCGCADVWATAHGELWSEVELSGECPSIHMAAIYVNGEQAIYIVLIVFIVPQVVATNFATLIRTRIITGACSGMLANITSGIVSDIWRAGRARSFGTSLYIWALLAGLSMEPVFGSLTVQYTIWRW